MDDLNVFQNLCDYEGSLFTLSNSEQLNVYMDHY